MPRVPPLLSSSIRTTIIIIFTVLNFNHHFRAYDLWQSDMKNNGFSHHGLLRVFALFYIVWKSAKRKLGKKSGFLHFYLIWFQVHLEAWHWPCQSSSDGGSSQKSFRTHRPTSDGQHANMVLQKYSPNLCRQPEALSDDNFRETAALVGLGLIFLSVLKLGWTS